MFKRRFYVTPVGDQWLTVKFSLIEAFAFDFAMYGLRIALRNLWDTARTYGTKHVEFVRD